MHNNKTEAQILTEWADHMIEESTDEMVSQDAAITPETLSQYFEKEYELSFSVQEARKWLESRAWYHMLVKQAQALPIGGSLTFRMLVSQRDWPAVYEMASSQVDAMHGLLVLSEKDWDYIKAESAKDGFSK